jgi:hypothetical protein
MSVTKPMRGEAKLRQKTNTCAAAAASSTNYPPTQKSFYCGIAQHAVRQDDKHSQTITNNHPTLIKFRYNTSHFLDTLYRTEYES